MEDSVSENQWPGRLLIPPSSSTRDREFRSSGSDKVKQLRFGHGLGERARPERHSDVLPHDRELLVKKEVILPPEAAIVEAECCRVGFFERAKDSTFRAARCTQRRS